MSKPQTPKYESLTQLEHILKRPTMYIGSVTNKSEVQLVANLEDDKFILGKNEIDFSDGFLRLFIEIISNSIDNVWRSSTTETPCTRIKVVVNQDTGEISVWNDGQTIPIEVDEKTKLYNPEMIFGKLLTGSNYDDDEHRFTSGLNGLGSKLSNIFSSEFKVDLIDNFTHKRYQQTWNNNMKECSKPKISKNGKKGYTHITFKPDYKYFKIDKITDDILSLIRKYTIEMAMLTKVNVFFNDKKIPVKNLQDYIKLYKDTKEHIYIKTEDSEVILLPSTDGFEQISYINGINTLEGGVHVDSWIEKLVRPIFDKYKKQITMKELKQYFNIYVNCLLPNPEFTSQTKMKLSSPKPKVVVEEKHIRTILRWATLKESLDNILKSRELVELKSTEKNTRSFKKIKGYDPANFAGKTKRGECILILSEGLSAKTFAVKGLKEGFNGKKGRDYLGILALKGKVMNTRNASVKQITNNTEITNIIQILNLKHNKDYTKDVNFNELNYGKLMILTDADCIKGDTPLILKDKDDNILVKNIEDLTIDYEEIGIDKYRGYNNEYQVWCDDKWVDIKRIIKKKTDKKIIRVLTHTGIVDVTEDHSLFNEDESKIKSIDCNVGENLLHNFPLFNKIEIPDNYEKLSIKDLWNYASIINLQHYQSYNRKDLLEVFRKYKEREELVLNNHNNITPDEAFVMGFFLADGSCGIYEWKHTYKNKDRPRAYTSNRTSLSWHLDNTDLELLEKCQGILTNVYGDWFNLVEINTKGSYGLKDGKKMYRLILNGGIKTKHIIENYRRLFYYGKEKYIHKELLNATKEIREKLFEGFYLGDGRHDLEVSKVFDVNSKITSQCLYILCKSIGYEVSINKGSKEKVYSMCITKFRQSKITNKIKKIIDLGYTNEYVYDIEVDDDKHRFNAGVGELVVSNCDGYHISGLIMNFIHSMFPSLIKRGDFLLGMMTPIINITIGKQIHRFYNMEDSKDFQQQNEGKRMQVKYLKGLGSSTDSDIKNTFGKRMANYVDDTNTDKTINKVFNQKQADERKTWMEEYDCNNSVILDTTKTFMPVDISDFLNLDMIKFSIDDCLRSIPNVYDGLKQSQRKILYASLIKGSQKLKVSQLAGFVSEKTNYHHGEECLNQTIIKMAQTFVGSNNINILEPEGQLGSRVANGRDAASPRYVFTRVDPIVKKIFPEADNKLLDYINDDGDIVEPEYYVPTIPMILVNGITAIGTGWSSNIPSYNPEDLKKCVKLWLDNKELPDITPYYKGFKGSISKIDEKKYQTLGTFEKMAKTNWYRVTEIPIGTSIDGYKEYLEDLIELKKIKSMNNYSNDEDIQFEINVLPGFKVDIDTLKLKTYLHTSNMVCFTDGNKLKRFGNVQEIIDIFCSKRLSLYKKKKRISIT